MNDHSRSAMNLPAMVIASLFAALIVVGAYISIPIPGSPVPVVAQNLFVLLAGMVLGWRWAAASVGVYLLLGILGLPVFSGGRGGIAHFLGPTGGYLVGFLVAAVLTALVCHGTRIPRWMSGRRNAPVGRRLAREIVAVLVGTVAIYAVGVPWLKAVTGMTWPAAFAAGVLPFLPGDALKAAAAVAAARLVEPALTSALAGRAFGYRTEQ